MTRRAAGSVLTALLAGGAVLLVWYAFLALFPADSFLSRSPGDVWRYLVTGPDAAVHRGRLAAGIGRTLADAGPGFGVGLGTALAAAVGFELLRPVRQVVLPVAMVLRSVPLVALAPLLTLLFGRGLLATTAITGLVVFFPALVNISHALRSGPRWAVDLCRVYGAGRWRVVRAVLLPGAVPAIIASARIAVPAALVGAMLAEWLATGAGLGYEMLQDASTFDYDHLWAAVTGLTAVSVLLYGCLGLLEVALAGRLGAAAGS
ncbi:ABC transporter permease [Dactylosporangium matsuzakiense]|uniref:ABC transporter permease n=1 Tax=Dactylosporangium matsuzakiense TaxID=53360 RepID=A0A9W6KGR0_9ACTN|nr:ABC transporter permease subunit [Dactylosporangium matsuzakiense]GLK99183.1 ABC transporter permease [Dactylosporangium matsuzakiense]